MRKAAFPSFLKTKARPDDEEKRYSRSPERRRTVKRVEELKDSVMSIWESAGDLQECLHKIEEIGDFRAEFTNLRDNLSQLLDKCIDREREVEEATKDLIDEKPSNFKPNVIRTASPQAYKDMAKSIYRDLRKDMEEFSKVMKEDPSFYGVNPLYYLDRSENRFMNLLETIL